MKRILFGTLVALILAAGGLGYLLLRPLPLQPMPAAFQCQALVEGDILAFDPRPAHIYGVGLSYSNHINETASNFVPGEAPPIFAKRRRSLSADGDRVRVPTSAQLTGDLVRFEPDLAERVGRDFANLPALLDYEAELAFVLLADVHPEDLAKDDFAPPIGFLVANDLSARSLAVFGEGMPNRDEYWGMSKSFPGFLPLAGSLWVPSHFLPNGLPCVTIETRVNGIVRQRESTENMIYTPRDMLRWIHATYPDHALQGGDLVLMGTPGGVAMSTPRAVARLGELLGLDRFAKLAIVLRKDRSKFLNAGDTVVVSGEGLGSVTAHITE